MLQRMGTLAEHLAGLMAHSVHHKVAVDVRLVAVGGDKHLAVRPRFRSKFPGDVVCLGGRDVLLRGEGLGVMVEPNRALLAVHLPGGGELLGRQLGHTVLTAEEHLTAFGVPTLLLLGHIFHHTAQRCGALAAVFDETDDGHISVSLAPPGRRAAYRWRPSSR